MDADARRRRPIVKLLDAAALDLDLQQAAEKILGAVRIHRGLINTKDHDLVILIDGRPGGEPRPLPDGDPWRDRFRPLEPLSAYATAFRYSLSPVPRIADLVAMRTSLDHLLALARVELLS